MACQAPSAGDEHGAVPARAWPAPRPTPRSTRTGPPRRPRPGRPRCASASPPVSGGELLAVGLHEVRARPRPGPSASATQRLARRCPRATRAAVPARSATSVAYQPSGAPGRQRAGQHHPAARRCARWCRASREPVAATVGGDRAPGELILVVVPSGSVIVMFTRTGPAGALRAAVDAVAAAARGRTGRPARPGAPRSWAPRRRPRRARCSRPCRRTGEVTASARSTAAALEPAGQRDGPVDARVGGEGDDHATTTSMSSGVECRGGLARTWPVVGDEHVDLVQAGEADGCSWPILSESASTTTRCRAADHRALGGGLARGRGW